MDSVEIFSENPDFRHFSMKIIHQFHLNYLFSFSFKYKDKFQIFIAPLCTHLHSLLKIHERRKSKCGSLIFCQKLSFVCKRTWKIARYLFADTLMKLLHGYVACVAVHSTALHILKRETSHVRKESVFVWQVSVAIIN